VGDIGPSEIVLLLLVALLLFGGKRLPEIGRSLGSGMREFKDSLSGITRDDDRDDRSREDASHGATSRRVSQVVASNLRAPPAS